MNSLTAHVNEFIAIQFVYCDFASTLYSTLSEYFSAVHDEATKTLREDVERQGRQAPRNYFQSDVHQKRFQDDKRQETLPKDQNDMRKKIFSKTNGKSFFERQESINHFRSDMRQKIFEAKNTFKVIL